MKRQVAITGATPEFLRWSIRQACPLRQDLEAGSVDATEKRLRAIRVASLAIGLDQIFDGVAAKLVDHKPKGFRLAEVFQVYGSVHDVAHHCQNCPANVLNEANRHGSLAGCHGWLPRTSAEYGEYRDLGDLIESTATDQQRLEAQELFIPTSKLWYGMWASRSLAGEPLAFVLKLFERSISHSFGKSDVPESLTDFRLVLKTCIEEQLCLDVELVPVGFSDGLRWTISPHCDHCRAPFEPGQQGCSCCQKTGKGHPEIHRKVRGLRPWVDLDSVLGPEELAEFLSRHDVR